MPLGSKSGSAEQSPERPTGSVQTAVGLAKRPTWLAFRSGLPAIGVLLIIGLVATVAYYLYIANRNGALLLSNDLVTAIETRISTEMYSYLEPSQKLAELIDVDVDGRPVFQERQRPKRLRDTPWRRSPRRRG